MSPADCDAAEWAQSLAPVLSKQKRLGRLSPLHYEQHAFHWQAQPLAAAIGAELGGTQQAAWVSAARGMLDGAPSTLPPTLPELSLLRWAVGVGELAVLVKSKGEALGAWGRPAVASHGVEALVEVFAAAGRSLVSHELGWASVAAPSPHGVGRLRRSG